MASAPLSPETQAAIRASKTALCWKRAADLPTTARITQGRCTTLAGIELAYSAVFPPVHAPLRGVVLFLHGINEHSERYFHLFEALNAMGFGALAYDLRSHGKSHMDVPGILAHVDDFQSFVDDTNAFITFAKTEIYPKMQADVGLPLVMMGMSLGTQVTVQTVLSLKHEIAGMVVVAPAVSVEWTWILTCMSYFIGILSAIAPTAQIVPGVNATYVCRDPLVTADYDADPLTTREQLTALVGYNSMKFMTDLRDNKTVEDPTSVFCKTPILMMMGSSDKVSSVPLAKEFYERIQNSDKHFELVDGAYHVLLEDFERERVMHLLQEWLQERFIVVEPID